MRSAISSVSFPSAEAEVANSSVVLVLLLVTVVVIIIVIVAEDGKNLMPIGIIGWKISNFGTRGANVSYPVTQTIYSSFHSSATVTVLVVIPSSSFTSSTSLLFSSSLASVLDIDYS